MPLVIGVPIGPGLMALTLTALKHERGLAISKGNGDTRGKRGFGGMERAGPWGVASSGMAPDLVYI